MKLLVDTCVFVDTFDPSSNNYADSLELLEELRNRNQLITMPAHAMFEVLCTLNRLTIENSFNPHSGSFF
jgi:predicted nucleic acid-binding protein